MKPYNVGNAWIVWPSRLEEADRGGRPLGILLDVDSLPGDFAGHLQPVSLLDPSPDRAAQSLS